jgi:hypothetical protein
MVNSILSCELFRSCGTTLSWQRKITKIISLLFSNQLNFLKRAINMAVSAENGILRYFINDMENNQDNTHPALLEWGCT